MGDTDDVDVKEGEKIYGDRDDDDGKTRRQENGGLPCASHQGGPMAMWGSAAQDSCVSCSKDFCGVSRLEIENKQHATNCRENDRCCSFARPWTPTREPGWWVGGLVVWWWRSFGGGGDSEDEDED
ncbi:hypothetical protein EMPG_12405 [Blastomyces silverae]|uniref:Uncharacterized protein n=1 Tax=Blastomyces silverae TaxID=2060906 RepID=A0A0H1BNI6_9EURO|nr:hypothetical protein EMPG_12405 [Blastomyces silverae]